MADTPPHAPTVSIRIPSQAGGRAAATLLLSLSLSLALTGWPPQTNFVRLSPTIPPISIPPIYYHSLTNYLINVFEFKKKSYSICTAIIHIIIVLRGSNGINIAKKRCD